MKNLLLSLGMIVMLLSANAQIQKGAIMIGGSFNTYGSKNLSETATSSNNFAIKSFSLNVKPQIGFMVSDHTQIGLSFALEHSYFKSRTFNANSGVGYPTVDKGNTYLINPYLTRYIGITEKFYLTTTANAMIGAGKTHSGIPSSLNKSSVFDIRLNLTPGIAYFVSDNLAITATIGKLYYSYSKTTSDGTTNTTSTDMKNKLNNFGMNLSSSSLWFGVQFFIR